ncbi:MAG: hypothetical protein Q7S00_07420 [bacterium]|nr:hypothetical protein [bacterium]
MSLSVYTLLHQAVEETAEKRNPALVADKKLSFYEWDAVIRGELRGDKGVQELNRFLGEALIHPQWIFDEPMLEYLDENTGRGVNAKAVEEIQERQEYGEEASEIARAMMVAAMVGGDTVFTEAEWETVAPQIKESWDEGGRFGVALCLNWMAEAEGWTLSPELKKRIQERLVDKGFLRKELLEAVVVSKAPANPEKPVPEKSDLNRVSIAQIEDPSKKPADLYTGLDLETIDTLQGVSGNRAVLATLLKKWQELRSRTDLPKNLILPIEGQIKIVQGWIERDQKGTK